MKQSIEDRFWKKVDKSGGPDACWPWTKGRDQFGYGHFCAGGKTVHANRMALILSGGTIPEGFCALHKCDSPPCCNPGHLFVGTHTENMADKVSKSRQAKLQGEKHPRSKLSNGLVLALKKLRALGWRQITLAIFFGISQQQVSNICSGKYRRNG